MRFSSEITYPIEVYTEITYGIPVGFRPIISRVISPEIFSQIPPETSSGTSPGFQSGVLRGFSRDPSTGIRYKTL